MDGSVNFMLLYLEQAPPTLVPCASSYSSKHCVLKMHRPCSLPFIWLQACCHQYHTIPIYRLKHWEVNCLLMVTEAGRGTVRDRKPYKEFGSRLQTQTLTLFSILQPFTHFFIFFLADAGVLPSATLRQRNHLSEKPRLTSPPSSNHTD